MRNYTLCIFSSLNIYGCGNSLTSVSNTSRTEEHQCHISKNFAWKFEINSSKRKNSGNKKCTFSICLFVNDNVGREPKAREPILVKKYFSLCSSSSSSVLRFVQFLGYDLVDTAIYIPFKKSESVVPIGKSYRT